MSISLSADNLIVGYKSGNKKKIVLEDISFEVTPGSVFTLIGPNGSGKSTILKTITSQLEKLDGDILVDGQNISHLSEKDLARKMSMVMTGGLKTELMTCRDIVSTGRYPYTGMLGILSDKDKEIVEESLKFVNALEVADADFANVSDGQRQRIMLARAICQEPEILVLDEPTSFLDIKYKLDILGNIKKLAKEKNIAVIMSLHELDFAKNISDFILAVNAGKIFKAGRPEEIFKGDIIQRLYGIKENEFDPETASVRFQKNAVVVDIAIAEANSEDVGNFAEDESVDKSSELVNPSSQKKASKVIMIQGTMSNAGKSLLVAGLCRVFMKDGYRVMPFKSQNMALNSFITKDGLEMGRAQVMQAECAGVEPHVGMNPILLKPTDDQGSQVIVNGKVIGNMRARDYFEYKTKLIPDIMKAYETLSQMADIIVVEGAGSPAEINLKKNDIVNMGLAKMLDAPVVLVGDIDRGGVFAQLLGTLELLEEDERNRVKGLIINKFRGDKTLLDTGIDMLEEKGGVKVTGVVPYMNINLEDEDSLSERFNTKTAKEFDIAVIRYPHISNFTDFDVFEQIEDISVRYVTSVRELGAPDIIMLPGSKNTIDDVKWLFENNFDLAINRAKDKGTFIFGICGGYQMLGKTISDPENVEAGGQVSGLGLLDVNTVLKSSKNTKQFIGEISKLDGELSSLSGARIEGYEIHMGETINNSKDVYPFTSDNTGFYKDNVYGSYVHGLFDNSEIAKKIVDIVAKKNGKNIDVNKMADYKSYKESQYDILEKTIRDYVDIKNIYSILGM